MQKTVLLADENPVERQLVARMLPDCFSVCQVKTGEQVLEKISRSGSGICAVILLLSVQQPSAYEVLRRIAETPAYESLPVLALAREGTQEQERTALRAGAWDYIAAPFEPEVLFLRLGNALERGAAAAGRAMRCLSQYDSLTGLYNKTHFFEAVRSMLLLRPDLRYVMLRFDVVRFQLVNTFFGAAEGDRVLRYLAKSVRELVRPYAHAAYGRMEADVFAVCVPYDEAGTLELLRALRARLAAYNTSYDILPACGLYIVEDNTMLPAQMYTCAALAAKNNRGNWENYYAFYTPEMHEVLVREQEIANEMRSALEAGQFIFYLQPQYNLQTGYPCGAEALVRWNHPQKGIVGPGEFIPVFEQNGFITRLDRYLWEQVCRRLRAWLDAGQKPYPISVNVSRVDVYNPHLYEELTGLVEQYGVPPRLMPLELTESAYADNPDALREVLVRLHQYGFPIHMDDFGSGYSSLNFLKDINLDVLKIDMRFLESGGVEGRGESILASVIRMAKWMRVPVVAEGVETGEQADFLRSLGCDYVQGYLYAKPMPVEDYEALMQAEAARAEAQQTESARAVPLCAANARTGFSTVKLDEFWTPNAQVNLLFNTLIGAVGIYELRGDKLELIRVNDGFYHITGEVPERFAQISPRILDVVVPADKGAVLDVFQRAVRRPDTVVEGAYRRYRADGRLIWIRIRAKYICSADDRHLLYGALEDVTEQKNAALLAERHATRYHILAEKLGMMLFDYNPQTDTIEYSAPDVDGQLHMIRTERWIETLRQNKLVAKKDLENLVRQVRMIVACGLDGSVEYQASFFGMGEKTYRVRYVCVRDADGMVTRVVGRLKPLHEASAPVQSIAERAAQNRQCDVLRLALRAADVSVWEWDILHGTAKQYLHSRRCQGGQSQFENFPSCQFESGHYHPRSAAAARAMFDHVRAGEARVHAQLRVNNGDGWWWEDVTYLAEFDAEGRAVRAVGLGRDVTQELDETVKLKNAYLRDPLTGLNNRAALQREMAKTLETPEGTGAFLLVDLDNFKRANDQKGHMYGDAVLAAVGDILSSVTRKSDVVARFGGDEFAVFLRGVNDPEIVLQRGQTICDAFTAANRAHSQEISLGCSVGAALAPQHGMTFSSLYEKADIALYCAKNGGKGRCCLYEKE